MSLDIEKLRITKEEGIALQPWNNWTWDERFTNLADAATGKALWGVVDWLESISQHFEPFIEGDWVDLESAAKHFKQALIKRLERELKQAGIERPKEEA